MLDTIPPTCHLIDYNKGKIKINYVMPNTYKSHTFCIMLALINHKTICPNVCN